MDWLTPLDGLGTCRLDGSHTPATTWMIDRYLTRCRAKLPFECIWSVNRRIAPLLLSESAGRRADAGSESFFE
jgi:hypothetical protein